MILRFFSVIHQRSFYHHVCTLQAPLSSGRRAVRTTAHAKYGNWGRGQRMRRYGQYGQTAARDFLLRRSPTEGAKQPE